MARLPHDTSAGHADSSTHPQATVLDANAGHTLTLPGHEYVTDAQMLRDGQDLVLHPAHGEDVIVKNYFSADPAPILSSADGGTALTHDLVESFVKPIGGVQYAQNGTMDDASPIGAIKESSGDATVTHANGTVQKAAIGTPIYEGDIVETKAHGAVNITFVDKTTFAVSENAKMAIDQYVFDPATQHGENNFSVLRGVFVFTSGLIGHADPDDVKIHTPVGSIGIRGTTIMGTINPGGDSHVSVVEGAIVVSNTTGEQTLSQQFETVKLNGMNQPITSEGVQSADAMANNYNVLRTVSGPLFSTFDDMGKEDNKTTQPGDQAPDAPAAKDAAPAHEAAPPAEAAPVNKSDAADPAAEAPTTATQITLDDSKASLDTGFDTSAGLKTATAFSNDTGVAASATTSSIAATSSAPAVAAAPAFVAPSASTTQTVAPSAPSITTTAPVSTGNTTTTTLPAFTLSVAHIGIAPGTAGTRVATVTSSVTTGVSYSWTSPVDGSGNPIFTLTPLAGGAAAITLTTAGATYVANLVNGLDILYTVNATLTDGRTATVNSDYLVPADYDLSLNSVITGGVAGAVFIPSVAAGSQHGSSPVSLGDYNHDGKMDYAFVTNTASGGKLFIDDASGNHYILNLQNTPFNIADTTNMIVSGMGDFNGDGKADILIGTPRSGSVINGEVFVMSGAAPGTVLSHIIGFADGTTGGASISGIGDFNGDGYSDILIGVPGTSNNGTAYMILGSATSAATIDINALSPSQGFALGGGLGFGASVSGIGDFNHDGYSDFAITDISANKVSFYYGGAAGINSGAVNITGLTTGSTPTIVSLGDTNGDGSSDFGIFDNIANKFYVFEGGTSRGTTGFSVTTANYAMIPGAGSVINVASAGDFNGDGLNDVALAIRNGSNLDIYVVYGSSTLAGTINPTNVANAYHMHLDLTSTQFNLANPASDAISVNLSNGGDLNNDGYDDLLIGLPNIDSNGGAHSNDGGLIIVNGSASTGSITPGLDATASFQSLVGTTGADSMSNGNAALINIHFNAGGGNDSISLFGASGASLIDGGTGIDTLHLMTGTSIDLRNADISNLENISIEGTGQVLTLTLDQVFTMLHTSENNTLHIDATTTGQLTIDTNKTGTNMTDAGFTDAGVSGNYHMYSQGQYTLYVDTDVTVVAQNV